MAFWGSLAAAAGNLVGLGGSSSGHGGPAAPKKEELAPPVHIVEPADPNVVPANTSSAEILRLIIQSQTVKSTLPSVAKAVEATVVGIKAGAEQLGDQLAAEEQMKTLMYVAGGLAVVWYLKNQDR